MQKNQSLFKIGSAFVFGVSCVILYNVQGANKATQTIKNDLVPDALIAEVDYIFDGDTFAAKVALKNDARISVRVRIMQIDTPEIHGQCDSEVVVALKAKKRLAELLPIGSNVKLSGVKDDKYSGRIDAFVTDESDRDIGAIMIKEKLARKYDGGHRDGWCK